MDSYCIIQIFFCDSLQNGNSKALRNFSCIRAQEMEAYNCIILCKVDDNFGIAVLSPVLVHIPL